MTPDPENSDMCLGSEDISTTEETPTSIDIATLSPEEGLIPGQSVLRIAEVGCVLSLYLSLSLSLSMYLFVYLSISLLFAFMVSKCKYWSSHVFVCI
jgi:hypothetical protein